eukprot:3647208-Pyramimonas_sp.AAC.1
MHRGFSRQSAHCFREGDRRSIRGLRGFRTDFRCVFWNLREIAGAVVDAGGTVCIEWPSQCQHWRDPQ